MGEMEGRSDGRRGVKGKGRRAFVSHSPLQRTPRILMEPSANWEQRLSPPTKDHLIIQVTSDEYPGYFISPLHGVPGSL